MPQHLSLRWRLAAAFLIIIALLVSLVGLYLLEWTEAHYLRSISDDLRRESKAVASFVQDAPPRDVPELVARAGRDLGHRITIIKPDGTVIADSEHDFRQMPNHADRPEVRQALATGSGDATRYSTTLKTRMLYVATTYGPADKPAGLVRIAEPLSALREVMSTIQRTFLLAALAAVLLAAILSLKLASGITAPIESIASAARKLAGGDLSARTPVSEKAAGEVKALASTFNHMAEQLQSTVMEITEQKARIQAIFERTDDGLVLIGHDGKIQMVNPATCRMIGVDCANAVGKTVIEGTLSHDLSGLVDRVVSNQEPAALDVVLPTDDETTVHAYVAPISSPDGSANVLVVLHDVTAIKRIDAIRRDFVANVSHELRTPLASIKAMAETIVLRHEADPSVAEQLAASIVQEADRMALLAQDLLELVKAESGRRELNPEDTNIRELVDDVFARLRIAAERKSISLVSQVAEGEVVRVDRDSVLQVLVNLVDNAVSYTGNGGTVTASSRLEDGRVAISVEDTGIGIPSEDLPRIFERFYRVDKARSRESGGTGLGLSIVKHLTELLGGNVSVTSEIGRGSTFTVTLPAG